MMNKPLTILFWLLLVGIPLSGHSGKPKYHVIIDTDGALDDMRAISMLLAGNDIRILAITCSQGTLMSGSVCEKVNSLLAVYHHEGIPVGISPETGSQLPGWSGFVESVKWGDQQYGFNPDEVEHSTQVLDRVTAKYPDKITLVALGSLKTYADWLNVNPDALQKVDKIIWYNDQNLRKGFNYQISPESFDFIKASGVKLEIVSGAEKPLIVDDEYLQMLRDADSPYAAQIRTVLSGDEVREKINRGKIYMWDDLVPLFMTAPVMFVQEKRDGITFASLMKSVTPEFIFEAVGKLLGSSSTANNRVFKSFPVDTTLYLMQYAGMVNPTIKKYGLIEWKAVVLTNEIHGHTGIYSIIGAKMGVRAMEFFNVGVNNMEVVSFAGTEPPLSCFNDGIQISTGSTIGQGLITISDSVSMMPSATFEFNGCRVNISLRPELALAMQEDIRTGIENYGLQTTSYWLYIESLAIRYWRDMDREEIFEIKSFPPTCLAAPPAS